MFDGGLWDYFLQFTEQNQKTVPEEKCQNTCTLMKINVRSKGKTIESDPNLSKFYCKLILYSKIKEKKKLAKLLTILYFR